MKGKGYPDLSTRHLVRRLSEEALVINRPFNIKALVDGDPHGVDIFLCYKCGSEVSNLFFKNIILQLKMLCVVPRIQRHKSSHAGKDIQKWNASSIRIRSI
jgi:DNA topoisomerase VI subunit A